MFNIRRSDLSLRRHTRSILRLSCVAAATVAIHASLAEVTLAQDAPAPAATSKPSPAIERLLDPVVASRLELTEEQQKKIAELWKARAAAIAAAAEADKAKAASENDQKILGILNAEQKKHFAELKPEPKLKFNFRFQKWVDVLEWVAEQSNLSLVLDAPPPATFNYTDKKDYSPTEAIDLLNSVLQSKGFTLVRRKRMLIVVDLKQGLPETLVPRITLDELDRRGRFEFVSVMFPLGARPVEEVEKEISPLLSEHGKAVALVKTKQILVTERAGLMRAVSAIIESIPEPKAPAKPTPPPPPEKPELKVYPVSKVDPVAAIETLKSLFKGLDFVRDPKAEQINVYATPSQHKGIAGFIKQLEEGEATGTKSRLETYETDRNRTAELIETIKLAVPNAQLRADSQTGGMIAWATDKDHATIKASLDKLGHSGSPQQSRQFAVYPMVKGDPNSAVSLLNTLVPNARLTVDSNARSIIAVANPADQAVIERTIEQIETAQPGSVKGKTIAFYPFKKAPPSSLLPVVQGLVPQAQVTVESDGKRWTVLATAGDHQVIAATVKQFADVEQARVKEKNQLKIYQVTDVQKKRLESLKPRLSEDLEGVEFMPDNEPGELLVWAKAAQHEFLAGILEELKQDVSEESKKQLASYTTRDADPSVVTSTLQQLFPQLQIISDPATKRLMIFATAEQHTKVKAAMEKIVADKANEDQSRFAVYKVRGVSGGEVISALQPLVPTARLSVDTKTGNVVAYATPREHQLLAQAVKNLGTESSPQETAQFEVYRMVNGDPSAAITVLQTLVPNARLTVDSTSRSVIAVAVPDDQTVIKSTIEEIENSKPADKVGKEIRFYPFKKSPPSSLLPVVQGLVPRAEVSVDTDGRRWTVVATPVDHDVIATTTKRFMDIEYAKVEEKPQLQIYQVTDVQKKRLETLKPSLSKELFGVRFLPETNPGEMMVWAKSFQHSFLKSMLKSLEQEVSEDAQKQLASYSTRDADPSVVTSTLQQLFPQLQVIGDPATKRLMIFATVEQHAKVKTAMEKLVAEKPVESQSRFAVYKVRGITAGEAVSALQPLVPTARLSVDSKTGNVVAYGTPADHRLLSQAVKSLGTETSPQETPQLEVYQLTKSDPQTTMNLLQTLLPQARLSVDGQRQAIIAYAIPADQKVIQSTINQLQEGDGTANNTRLQFYSMNTPPSASLISGLQQLVPQAQVSYDAETKKLMVVARPSDHEIIGSAIDSAVQSNATTEANRLEIYAVTPAQRKRFMGIYDSVQAELPGIRVITDAEPGELAIWAKPSQHVVLAEIVKKVAQENGAKKGYKLVAYPVTSSDPNSALSVIQELFPGTRVVLDAKTRRLLIWTSEEEHKLIKQSMEQVNAEVSADMKEVFRLYPLQRGNPDIAISMLQPLLMDARLMSDREAGGVMAWAREADHKIIEKIIKQIELTAKLKDGRTVAIYNSGEADRGQLLSMLRSLVPNARVDDYAKMRKIAVWGTDEEHDAVRGTIEKIVGEEAAVGASQLVVYPVKSVTSTTAIQVLRPIFPEATYNGGADGKSIIVWARADEHKEMADLLKQVEAEADSSDDAVYVVYPLHGATGATLTQLLTPFQAKGATFIPDTTRDSLIVRADEEMQAEIKTAIEELTAKLPKTKKMVSKVYRLKNADAYSSYVAIASLIPTARMSVDVVTQTVAASAFEEDHVKIQKLVDELDREGTGSSVSVMRSYRVETTDTNTMLSMLSQLFGRYQNIRFSADQRNGIVAALATEEQHKKIQEMIDEVGKSENGNKSHVYKFKTADPYAAQTVFQTLVPNARIAVDQRNRSLVVSASPAEHKRIKETIDQMDGDESGEGGLRLRSYPVLETDPSNAQTMLRQLFTQHPEVQITLDYYNDTIVALATEEQHKRIQTAMVEVEKNGRQRTTKVYQFKNADANNAWNFARSIAPRASIAFDNRTDSLVVNATAAEHKKIAETVKELEAASTGENVTNLQSYSLKKAEPNIAVSMLQTMFSRFPEVRISLDQQARTILVLAKTEQHGKIKETLDEIESNSAGRESRVYHFERADPNTALNAIRAIVPSAQMGVDTSTRSLVVSALPAEHETIANTIKQMDGVTEGQLPVLKSYSLGTANPQNALSMLQTLFATRPEIRISLDPQSGSITALASPAQHETIDKAVTQIREKGDERVSKVYRLQFADPNSTSVALQGLIPNARIVYEARTRSVVVSGSAVEQQIAAKTIKEIDGEEGDGQRPVLKSYRVRNVNPNTIGRMLTQLFAAYPEVRISADRQGEAVVAIAPAALQKQIAAAIDEAESASGFDQDVALESYPLEGIDAQSALKVLEDLTDKYSGQVVLTVDQRSNQLFAMAEAGQQKLIADALSKLKTERPEVEVFQLEVLDPITAEIAIDRLFSVDGYSLVANAPLVDSDENTQQLYIRGTKKQMGEIRELLVKMGETQLATPTVGSQKTLRVIPFQGDAKSAIREIQRVWPNLRKNSIRVVVPSAVAPTIRRFRESNGEGDTKQDFPKSDTKGKPPGSNGQFSVPPEDLKSNKKQQDEKNVDSQAANFPKPTAEPDKAKSKQPAEKSKPVKTLAPVVIAPGDGSITISSDDLEALDQLESLLRSMSRHTSRGSTLSRGRDYIVFSLKHSSASVVADSLNDLFRRQNGGGRRRGNSRVQIVPDERLNAIIVYANQADREVIEDLLQVLDTDDVPVSVSATQPVVIQVENTDATRIDTILRNVYRAQLSQGGGRRPLPVPTGVSEDTIAAIEQYNASVSAPLLSISVDELTNALVVTGPAQLVGEVRELVNQLDTSAADGTTRELTILPLKKVNSERVQEALDVIFRERNGSNRRARNSNRNRNRRSRGRRRF